MGVGSFGPLLAPGLLLPSPPAAEGGAGAPHGPLAALRLGCPQRAEPWDM